MARAPLRGAAGDAALRVMLSEIASAKACKLMEGQFRPLRAPDRHQVVTGTLWIRACEITNEGTHVVFHLSGNGWQWVDQTKHQAGGTFVVREYVRFGVSIEMPGALDIAYDPGSHIASLWFSPDRMPDIKFSPLGKIDVDRDGTWSSILGAVSSIFASSPEKQAHDTAKHQGTEQFAYELADGMAVTIDLCTGLSRFNLGRPVKGAMQYADAGETRNIAIELQPRGVLMFGPQLAPNGMTVNVDAREGAVRIGLACQQQANELADAWLAGDLGEVPYLAMADVYAHGRVHVPPQRCPVVVVARSLDQPAAFDWQRPASEIAGSTGGAIIHCAKQR